MVVDKSPFNPGLEGPRGSLPGNPSVNSVSGDNIFLEESSCDEVVI